MNQQPPVEKHELVPAITEGLQEVADLTALLGGVGRIHDCRFPEEIPTADASGFWARLKVQEQVVPGGTRSDPHGYDAPTILVVAEVADVSDPRFWPQLTLEKIHSQAFTAITEATYTMEAAVVMSRPRLLLRPTPAALLENPGRWYSTAFYQFLLQPTGD